MKIKYSEEIYFEIQNEILVYYQKKPLDKKISNKTLTCYGIPYEIPDEILNKIQKITRCNSEILIYQKKENENLKLLGKIITVDRDKKLNIIWYSSKESRFNEITKNATIQLIDHIFINSELDQISNSHIQFNKNETIEQITEFYDSCGFRINIFNKKDQKFQSICIKEHFYKKFLEKKEKSDNAFFQIREKTEYNSQSSSESRKSLDSQSSSESSNAIKEYSPMELEVAETLIKLFKAQ
jgi:hypothetical protein